MISAREKQVIEQQQQVEATLLAQQTMAETHAAAVRAVRSEQEQKAQEQTQEHAVQIQLTATATSPTPTKIETRVTADSPANIFTPHPLLSTMVFVAKQARTLDAEVSKRQLAASFTTSAIQESLTQSSQLHLSAIKSHQKSSDLWFTAFGLGPGVCGITACSIIFFISGPHGWLIGGALLTALYGAYCLYRTLKNEYIAHLLNRTHQHINMLENRCLKKIDSEVAPESKDDALFIFNLRDFLVNLSKLGSLRSLRCLSEIEKILEASLNSDSINISSLHSAITSKIKSFLQPSKNKCLRFFSEDASFSKCCCESDLFKMCLSSQPQQRPSTQR